MYRIALIPGDGIGKMFAGTEREAVLQETVMTRQSVDRVLRFAFELASERDGGHLTSATKSNGMAIAMPQVLSDPELRTADLGGPAGTEACGGAVAGALGASTASVRTLLPICERFAALSSRRCGGKAQAHPRPEDPLEVYPGSRVLRKHAARS